MWFHAHLTSPDSRWRACFDRRWSPIFTFLLDFSLEKTTQSCCMSHAGADRLIGFILAQAKSNNVSGCFHYFRTPSLCLNGAA